LIPLPDWAYHSNIVNGEVLMRKAILMGLMLLNLAALAANAQTCTTLPNTLTNGTTADASQ
jgi:hypothetical protein